MSTTVPSIIPITYLIFAAQLVQLDEVLAIEIALRLPGIFGVCVALPFQKVLNLQEEEKQRLGGQGRQIGWMVY